MDARVLDWIDDKVAALSDFQELDSLLDNVKAQQELLKQQVRPTSQIPPGHEGIADTMLAGRRAPRT